MMRHHRIPTAANYYVRYKDYIKNVASSEIYATWPDATIRANVLAIMSFTLNRIYTEFYRERAIILISLRPRHMTTNSSMAEIYMTISR